MSFNAAALALMREKGLSLDDVVEIATAMEARSSAAERQARYRRNKRERDVTGDVTPVSKESHSNLSSSEPKGSSDQETSRARKADKFPCPEGVEPQHWADFLANRRTKRLTNTPTAHRGILRDLAKFADDEWPPGRIVEFAAARGWGGIFDPRTRQDGRQGRANGISGHQSGDGRSATTRAAERVFGQPFAAGQPH